jgi:NADH:ubiquinone oxidoreductase subunit F (NADH-binding)
VVEAMEGRPNLPVTSWRPEAVHGLGGRPTLLSNAETFAQIAALVSMGPSAYGSVGTDQEPGTTLLTIAGDGPGGVVLEVPFGTPLSSVLETCGYERDCTVLLGGYHGAWLRSDEVVQRRVSRTDLIAAGATIGAGIILPLDRQSCPVVLTARIVEYLAGQSARRCGPCKHGLPALAESVGLLADRGGFAPARRATELLTVLSRRGSCAHPDGTIRLVSSLLKAFPDEVTEHERGRCNFAQTNAMVTR